MNRWRFFTLGKDYLKTKFGKTIRPSRSSAVQSSVAPIAETKDEDRSRALAVLRAWESATPDKRSFWFNRARAFLTGNLSWEDCAITYQKSNPQKKSAQIGNLDTARGRDFFMLSQTYAEHKSRVQLQFSQWETLNRYVSHADRSS